MKSILFVQHGDFRNAYLRFANSGPETYRDQKKSVNFVSNLAARQQVTVLSLGSESYRTELSSGLFAQSVQKTDLSRAMISEIFDQAAPTHVVLRTPHLGFLTESTRRNCWVLPCFADIFQRASIRQIFGHIRLRHALMHTKAPCIANHSLNASRSLVTVLKIPPHLIVPWDWSKMQTAGSAKTGVENPEAPSAFFAGAMTEEKGLGDCLNAVAILKKSGLKLTLTVAGGGEPSPWRRKADQLKITNQVRFLGMIGNAEVRNEMRAHDFVIVPSRHSYPEGLPNTLYEALASRSVLIMSDHPAFLGRLEPDNECLVFSAGRPEHLANCIKTASMYPEVYSRISKKSAAAHDKLYVGISWSSLVENFISDPCNLTGWVSKSSLYELCKQR